MPRQSKFLKRIDEQKLKYLLDKYGSQLEGTGWRNPESIWGRIVSELGLGNISSTRNICYKFYMRLKETNKENENEELNSADNIQERNGMDQNLNQIDYIARDRDSSSIGNSIQQTSIYEDCQDNSNLNQIDYIVREWDSSPDFHLSEQPSQFGELHSSIDISFQQTCIDEDYQDNSSVSVFETNSDLDGNNLITNSNAEGFGTNVTLDEANNELPNTTSEMGGKSMVIHDVEYHGNNFPGEDDMKSPELRILNPDLHNRHSIGDENNLQEQTNMESSKPVILTPPDFYTSSSSEGGRTVDNINSNKTKENEEDDYNESRISDNGDWDCVSNPTDVDKSLEDVNISQDRADSGKINIYFCKAQKQTQTSLSWLYFQF